MEAWHRFARPAAPAAAWVALGLLALPAACAPGPSGPRMDAVSRTYAMPPQEAFERTRAAARASGLDLVRADPAAGTIVARAQDLGESPWLSCGPIYYYDTEDERRRSADPLARNVTLSVEVTPAPEGSRVSLTPRFSQTYLNTFTNLRQERGCRSTGQLEREIMQAI